MSGNSTHNSTLRELNELLNDEEFLRFSPVRNAPTTNETINQGTPLSMLTTPDALNTAIYEETPTNDTNDQRRLSQEYNYISQTTHQALQTISDLVDIVSRDNNVGIPTPTVQSMMLSKETMTQTPIKMVSTGTMPQTPVRLLSTGTTPRTPLIVSRATLSGTPTSVSVEVTVRLGASSSDVSTNTDPAPSSSFNRHEQ